ncbi:MAG: transcriptional repressor NrdR [Peptostreptococcaceae bacterium]|jgi:transcriptional regulator nrdR|nr:transcriptional repressor NrdR [Peptostreptococcaceae bacterium]
MKCPYCGSENIRVMDSRHIEEENAIKRRRECESCKKRFGTLEIVQDTSIIVIKKDGRKEFFDKEKILRGIIRSCQKRPVTLDKMQEIADDIEKQVMNSMDKEITSTHIGELVISRLRKLDDVSYIRFASVYRQFKDLNSFYEELNFLLDDEKK